MIAPQLYEPSTGTFSATGTSRDRTGHAATILADGRVLLVGGQDSLGILATADIYDPASGTFGQTASMAETRHFHTVTRLPDGSVLVVGGFTESDPVGLAETFR